MSHICLKIQGNLEQSKFVQSEIVEVIYPNKRPTTFFSFRVFSLKTYSLVTKLPEKLQNIKIYKPTQFIETYC